MIPRTRSDALALVVFDWDGTLIDSIARIVRCLHLAIEGIGAEPRTDAQLRDIIGLGVQQATEDLYPGADDAFMRDLTRAYREHYLERDTTPTPLYPDAEATLRILAERGFLLAVATGKSRRGLDEALEVSGLAGYFDATVTADEHPSKPHPGMLAHLLDRLGVERRDAVMIGDSAYDLLMARSLRVLGVGITHGAHDRYRLRRSGAAALIDELSEIPPLLESKQRPA